MDNNSHDKKRRIASIFNYIYNIVFMLIIFLIGVFLIYFAISNKKIFDMQLNFITVDVIYLLLAVVCVKVCVLFSTGTNFSNLKAEAKGNEYFEANRLKNIWLGSTNLWLVIHYWFVSSSYMATLFVIYIVSSDKEDTNRILFYSIMSLITSIMDYVISPMTISRGYRNAYETLKIALIEYDYNIDKFSSIKEAITLGENSITTHTYDKK